MGGRHASQYAAAVNAPPNKVVVGEAIGIIPGGHFVADKVVHTAFFQNLRQNPAIAEHIRQPSIIHPLAKHTLIGLLAVKTLTNETLCRRDIAVRLHIHSTHRLELPPGHFLLQFGKHIRVILLQCFIHIGLGVGVLKVRVAVHQPQLDEHRAQVLLHSMNPPPVVGNIQVTVRDQRHIPGAFVSIVSKDHIVKIRLARCHTGHTIIGKVQAVHGIVQLPVQERTVIFIKQVATGNIQQQLKVIDQILHGVIHSAQIRALKDLAAAANRQALRVALIVRLRAVITHHFKMQGLRRIRIGRQQHTLPIRIHTANIAAVDLHADFCRCFQREPKFLPLQVLWHLHIRRHKGGTVRGEIHIPPL